MFDVDQSNFPLPTTTLVKFGVLSVGVWFMFEGGLFMKTSATTAWLFATVTDTTIDADADVRLVDIKIVVTPFTA